MSPRDFGGREVDITPTGASAGKGSLVLTDQQGEPLNVSGTLTDSSGVTWPASVGANFAVTIPSGGTIFLSAAAATTGGPLKAGWGVLSSTGGVFSGVATYENAVGATARTIVGVLQSTPLQYATIPVDNAISQQKQLAYAIANPSGQTISITLALVGQDGTVVDDTAALTLGPWKQLARYLYQDTGRMDSRGSLVLRVQGGATFVAVALIEKQALFSAIPLIPGKAPAI